MKKIVATTLALMFVFGALPTGRAAGFHDLNDYFNFSLGDRDLPAGVYNVAGQQTSADGLAVKFFGECGPIDGASFSSGFVLAWNGSFAGPINPGDKFVIDFNFNVQATGGDLAWSCYSELWSVEGFEGARILPTLTSMPPSGQVIGAHLESSPFTQSGENGVFSGHLQVAWTGFSPTDLFSISIPQNSVDITYVPVPEPGVASIGLVALAIALIQRSGRRTR